MNPLNLDESPFLQRASRLIGALVVAVFLVRRLSLWGSYGSEWLWAHSHVSHVLIKSLWFAETLFFLILLISYLFRNDAKSYACGFREAIFPYFCALMPFLLARSSFFPASSARDFTIIHWGKFQMNVAEVQISPWPLILVLSIMLTGILISASALPCMIRSFSIKAEVRELVLNGPYMFVRHPIYLGEFFSALGLLLLRFSWLNLLIFIVFAVMQNHRATIEEEKIQSIYPEYEKYKRDIGKYFPRARQRATSAGRG